MSRLGRRRLTQKGLGRIRRWAGRPPARYTLAAAAVGGLTLLLLLVPPELHPSPRSIVYLVVVLAAGAGLGRGPAVLAAALSFLAFDWYFVPPTHTLAVRDGEEWEALLLFLLVAVVTGQLTAQLRHRADEAHRREAEAVTLFEVGKALASGASGEQALLSAVDRLQAGLGLATCDVLLPAETRAAAPPAGSQLGSLRGAQLSPSDRSAAQWVLTYGTAATRGWARGTHRLVRVLRERPGTAAPAAEGPHASGASAAVTNRLGSAFVPLRVEGRTVGVLQVVAGSSADVFSQQGERFLAAVADHLALAVERGRLQREMVRAEVLERTDQLRGALLSAVSHDLRTPLAAIKAAAGSLLQDVVWDDAARRSFAGQIEREADRLDRLVGNLLDLSRIQAGALVLDLQWYPLLALAEDTVARLEPALRAHPVDIRVDDAQPPVRLDYVLMQQVLANLLENAAKYSPAGSRIVVDAASAGNMVRLTVEDQGMGLHPWERERVFRPFYRVSADAALDEAPDVGPAAGGQSAGERHARSTGLGLAVCAGFVAAHGGRIFAESVGPVQGGEGGGTRFVVELPVADPPAGPAPRAHDPLAPALAPAAPAALAARRSVHRVRRRAAPVQPGV